MADAHGPAVAHGDAHGASSGGFDVKKHFETGKAVAWLFAIAGIIILALFLVFLDPQNAQNFIYFLNGLEIIFGFYIAIVVYKIWGYMRKFDKGVHTIEHIFEHKYHPKKKEQNVQSPVQQRFERAKKHITSKYKEEWKIGIIELDTVLKDLLKEKYKVGETVGDLLKTAEQKGLKSINNAWEAHKIRNRIVHEGISFDMTNDMTAKALRDYTTVFNELGLAPVVENVQEEEHHDDHGHH